VDDLFDALEASGVVGTLVLGVVRGSQERETTVNLKTGQGDSE